MGQVINLMQGAREYLVRELNAFFSELEPVKEAMTNYNVLETIQDISSKNPSIRIKNEEGAKTISAVLDDYDLDLSITEEGYELSIFYNGETYMWKTQINTMQRIVMTEKKLVYGDEEFSDDITEYYLTRIIDHNGIPLITSEVFADNDIAVMNEYKPINEGEMQQETYVLDMDNLLPVILLRGIQREADIMFFDGYHYMQSILKEGVISIPYDRPNLIFSANELVTLENEEEVLFNGEESEDDLEELLLDIENALGIKKEEFTFDEMKKITRYHKPNGEVVFEISAGGKNHRLSRINVSELISGLYLLNIVNFEEKSDIYEMIENLYRFNNTGIVIESIDEDGRCSKEYRLSNGGGDTNMRILSDMESKQTFVSRKISDNELKVYSMQSDQTILFVGMTQTKYEDRVVARMCRGDLTYEFVCEDDEKVEIISDGGSLSWQIGDAYNDGREDLLKDQDETVRFLIKFVKDSIYNEEFDNFTEMFKGYLERILECSGEYEAENE